MRVKSKRYKLAYVSRPEHPTPEEFGVEAMREMTVVAPHAVAARRFVLESEWYNGRLVSTFLDVEAGGA